MPSGSIQKKSGTDFRKLELLARADADTTHVNRTETSTKGKRKKRDSMLKSIQKLCLRGSEETPWVERYFPKSLVDHFVHKSKIAQFESWLRQQGTRTSSMALLTGPAGAGKTATVHLVANELGFHVKEWMNPVALTQYRAEDWRDRDTTEEMPGRSATDLFVEFLLRSSQYRTLPLKGRDRTTDQKSLILVEEFPNFFYKDLSLLHQLMRNYKKAGGCPLVFIMTDSTSTECSAYKLFPKALLLELDVQEIALNPVASSFMTKFANCVLAQAKTEIHDDALLPEIIASSGGDMRFVINNLQFRLQISRKSLPSFGIGPISKKRKLNTAQEHRSIEVSTDESLFLFHAIGKVLYCKRDKTEITETELGLKENVNLHRRIHPLKEIPEEIGDKIGVSPETFFNFLAQNYLSFFTSLTDVVTASAYLADAAVIFSRWVMDDTQGSQTFNKKCDAREDFGLSISIRGLMFANQNPVASTWRPLKKPKLRDASNFAESMIQNTHVYCPGPVTKDYFTDLVPYSALLCSKFPQAKRDFLKEYGRFQHFKRDVLHNLEEANGGGVDDEITEAESVPAALLQDNVTDRENQDASDEFDIEEIYD